mmetsp:Transcript_16908/g.24488  ORF Transcript_16908/g.24488 Transcript_16908/m.24488 type:complete len:431 (+) Transcript_16908:41-1333(+)
MPDLSSNSRSSSASNNRPFSFQLHMLFILITLLLSFYFFYSGISHATKIAIMNKVDSLKTDSIDSALNNELAFKLPTSSVVFVNTYPQCFELAYGEVASSVDWWLYHPIDGEAEISVVSIDAGWLHVILCLCEVQILRDQASESSVDTTRRDATVTKNGAIVIAHEGKFAASQLEAATNSLTAKLFPEARLLFPMGTFEIVGIVTSATSVQMLRIFWHGDEFHTTVLHSYDVSSLEDRMRFLIDIAKLCKWIANVKQPNKSFHLFPGVRTKTTNGHFVTWLGDTILKQLKKREGYKTTVARINTIREMKLQHVEWGQRTESANAILITRVGKTLRNALRERIITKAQVLVNVRDGIQELHNAGFAHCDIRIDNLFVDERGAFVDDLEYLTPTNEHPPNFNHIQQRTKPKTARELDMLQLVNFENQLLGLN